MGCFVGVSRVFAALLLLANLGYFKQEFVKIYQFSVNNNDKLSEIRHDNPFRFIF